jgi:hypothetical protein
MLLEDFFTSIAAVTPISKEKKESAANISNLGLKKEKVLC